MNLFLFFKFLPKENILSEFLFYLVVFGWAFLLWIIIFLVCVFVLLKKKPKWKPYLFITIFMAFIVFWFSFFQQNEYKKRAINNAAKIGNLESIRFLKKLAMNKDPELRRAVAFGIIYSHMKNPAHVKIIETLAKDKNSDVRSWVALNLAKVKNSDSIMILRALAVDENPDVRIRVVYSLEEVNSPDSIKLLKTMVMDKDPKVVSTVKRILKRTKIKRH